jgi:CDP-diacylglycerol---glycerol-3-phosphate 3-phosphatidyltransferase
VLEHRVGPPVRRLLEPVAARLLSWGVTADAVTISGTLAVVGASMLLANGWLVAGSLAVAFFAMADTLDGAVARLSGRSAPWGAFLDSTLDRVADAAVFASLVIWTYREHDARGFLLSVAVLATVGLVPYARARAEGLGASASDGIAARADRLGWTLAAVLAVGLGAPRSVLHAALALLLLAIGVTVTQRVAAAHSQLAHDRSRVG